MNIQHYAQQYARETLCVTTGVDFGTSTATELEQGINGAAVRVPERMWKVVTPASTNGVWSAEQSFVWSAPNEHRSNSISGYNEDNIPGYIRNVMTSVRGYGANMYQTWHSVFDQTKKNNQNSRLINHVYH
jgi:DNA/RNA endonuclease G (NUC1)